MTADESKRRFYGMSAFQMGMEFGDAGNRGALMNRDAYARNSKSKALTTKCETI